MELDLNRVQDNVRAATTADLLDRATIYRPGMEASALVLIDAELRSRGVGPAELATHGERRAAEVILDRHGVPWTCHLCHRPAVERRWVWGRLWKVLPLFPRRAYLCALHLPFDEDAEN